MLENNPVISFRVFAKIGEHTMQWKIIWLFAMLQKSLTIFPKQEQIMEKSIFDFKDTLKQSFLQNGVGQMQTADEQTS